jgi:NAD(P)-dependent dehydrogenase (short-subunit alcohol dehydrogenase family)
MKKLLIIGGSGGLGSQLTDKLKIKYDVTSVNSKELNVKDIVNCEQYFENNKFDIVLNFAGVNYNSFVHKINKDNVDNINNLIDVNIKGAINVVSSCLNSMREKKYGRIILISSVLSEKNVVGTSIYSASKSFLDKFVKNISLENIKYGITSNTLQLGYFDGGMTYQIPNNLLDNIKQDIGLNRFGSIEELINTIDFIIENEYVTGINLKIDGGLK